METPRRAARSATRSPSEGGTTPRTADPLHSARSVGTALFTARSSASCSSAPRPARSIKLASQLPRCYTSREPHCKLLYEDGGLHIESYQVQWLTSMRVFSAVAGTVFGEYVLWTECLSVGILYVGVFVVMVYVDHPHFEETIGDDASIRAFLEMFSMLIGLLLTFYTSLRIGRWWSMREDGIRKVSDGCEKLTLLLSSGVTQHPEVLLALRRYAEASLYLFWIRDMDREQQLDLLQEKNMLTKDEAQKLSNVENCKSWPEALWVWLANVVTKCNQAGLTDGPPHYVELLTAVDASRRGAAHIRMFFETPLPMSYVHLLGLMVKVHNVVLCLLMALVGAKHYHQNDIVAFCRTCFRAAFMPFLYNSIMILSDQLADPFGIDPSCFPYIVIRNHMLNHATGFHYACHNLPAWVKRLKGEGFKDGQKATRSPV